MVLSRLRPQARHIVLLLIFVLGIVSVLFVQLPGSSLLWRELQNTGHTILFAILALTFMGLLRGVAPSAVNKALVSYAIAGAVLVTAAVLTELGQLLTHREPSLNDMVRDMAGGLIGLGLYVSIDTCFIALCRQYCYVLRIGAFMLSCCLLAVSLLPLLQLALAYVQRNEAFPVVIDFQADWTKPFLQLNQAVLTRVAAPGSLTSGKQHHDHQQVSELKLNRGHYPGISMIEPYPDWSAYNTLILDVYSLQAHALSLVLRIHDSQHNQEYSDRFNQTLTVMPGMNRFRIQLLSVQYAPVNRDMDMSHIASVILFAVNIDGAVKLYPGMLNLE